ncbi:MULTISPECIES: ribosome biogenesis GTP-binding protein YihA/YsxC [Oceanospirillaceae]|jgi:GTP-binding protein|uniref:ribosome biogenesis GTP-binding protein YihA/YsxC n=1 Tax=Oceanospirillaceae TaxID=135620 RepID=UPI000C3E9249|nr:MULTISPECIES: ribosome biogenesis GTP-binding protein YihA/YsxC [Thalassolituus]PIQ39947.1 MAG: YihA family ribosome biogenesis GTP-binding protein [Thalassolituus sp. CG17_big_fil_post_rev_8_21_14_2_50_53_8]MCA6058932.1 YihA family ribosome biogenesis GTP-binding protein [Thalassolituus sp. ST750PaO-4]MCB2387795.1 ribosome biogenesis GTP-binding protein YihA/YsxC [Thalassolituus alkanivorans]MCB2422505.1 ribosome biogenesis GTP-binding protein YihA/YsxC [Thalassolituus alkanivorans]TVV4470|tara:strand:- start:495 stop:1148 length:654 start_codon:yes stop_codon:yes gene_type:complete
MIEQESLTYTNTHFVKSAAKLSQCPMDILREVAFAGRSNAGKSSALNRLTGHKKLARTSKTPGRTQLINYFQIGELPLALVDLPGYGFAKVPLAVKNEWQRELDNYLQNRDALIGLVLLMDIRHPLKEFDNAMIQWAKRSEMPLHILLTKADKLKRGPAQSALLQVRKAVSSLGKLVSVQTYSSLNGEGTDELQKRLNSWLLPPEDVAAETEETPEA